MEGMGARLKFSSPLKTDRVKTPTETPRARCNVAAYSIRKFPSTIYRSILLDGSRSRYSRGFLRFEGGSNELDINHRPTGAATMKSIRKNNNASVVPRALCTAVSRIFHASISEIKGILYAKSEGKLLF